MKPKGTEQDPEGLLEYLEDIIGTNRFIEPLNEAQARIDTLVEDRNVKLNRLRYVEKEKGKLEEEKKKAEAYIKLCNEAARAKSKLYQVYLWHAYDVQKKIEREMTQWNATLKEEQDKYKDDVEHLKKLEKSYQERQALYEEVQATADALSSEIAGMQRKEITLEERQKHTRTKLKKEKKKLQDDENAKSTAEQSFASNTAKIADQKAQIEEHEANLVIEEKALEKIRDSLREKTAPFHLKIEQKQKELQPWTAQITVKQSEINNATSERDALAKRAEQVKLSCAASEEELANLEGDLSEKAVERDQLRLKRTNLQVQGNEAGAALKDAQDRANSLRQNATTARGKVEEARASQAASRSNNKVLNTLNGLQSQGRVSGFHGRLGSLGTIPEKYDIAITTACGSLDHMVVDQVDQGQACIEYLRSQNAGRASFMVLSKLTRNDIGMNPMQTPAPRLFDLIKPKDPRFAAAFYKAIGNTLVANDLNEANRIAFGPGAGGKRWRVVTLAGQLIDSSGTMSGGGGAPRKGGMSAKLQAESVSPQVMSNLEKENGDASRMLDEALMQVRQAENEVDRVRAEEPRVQMDLSKLEMAIKSLEMRVKDVKKRVNELRAKSKPDAADVARISDLDKEIATSTEELKELETRSASISAAIKEFENKIIEIGGSKLLVQKSKVEGLQTYINIATEEITKAEVAVAKAEKDVTKLTASIKAGKASLEGLEEENAEVTEELEQVQGEVQAIRVKVEEAKEAVENQKEDLDRFKEELEEKTAEVQVFKEKEAGIVSKLTVLKKKNEENDNALDEWHRRHDTLKLQDVDDDDDEDEDESADAPAKDKDASEEPKEKVPDAMDEDEADPDADPQVKDEEDDDSPKRAQSTLDDRGFYTYSTDELKAVNERELKIQVEVMEERVTKGAGANLAVINEYRKRNDDYLRRAEELAKITDERDAQKQAHEALRRQRVDEFLAGFHMISLKLKELYQMITMGGNAELELVDTMDPFSEGINFAVMPPKKSWKAISNLSGGEKTLSSLALVFALHVFKPTPLYFMDEIDAALDFRNVSIVANYIKDRTKNAQFIIISLRNDMFELSQRLVGIYKTNNATHSITIDNNSLHGPSANGRKDEEAEKGKGKGKGRASVSPSKVNGVSRAVASGSGSVVQGVRG